MTFGLLKSIIEENLLESYKDGNEFKKSLNEFKHNVLNNKNLSRVYSIYDDLSKPQGFTEEESKEFINESLSVVSKLLPFIKIPKTITETKTVNKYQLIDDLVYTEKTNIKERLNIKKQIVTTLTQKPELMEAKVNIPLSSMVKIANQTLKNYIETLDESSKKEFFELIKEDSKILENKFEELRLSAIDKLNPIMEQEMDSDTKTKIEETITKIRHDQFNQVNYLKLKKLVESI